MAPGATTSVGWLTDLSSVADQLRWRAVEDRGVWTVFGARTVYDNRWVRLALVDVEAPNGERWEHHVVHLGRVAVALVVNDADEVLMLGRYRFATEQWGYELLGGLN